VAEAPAPTPPPILNKRAGWWIAIASVILAAAAFALTRWHSVPAAEHLANRAFVTSFPGNQTLPAISPDGGQVAFSWADPEREKRPSIYVTSINGLGLQQLTHSVVGDIGPVWSPDGSQIAFVRESADRSDVMVIPSSGGPERRIAETDGRFVSWAPGGGAVLTARQRPGERNFELSSVSLATGERRPVTAPGEFIDGWERFAYSPDGSTLAYAAWSGAQGPADLFIRPAAGGKPRQVTWLGTNLHGWWCWLPDSRSILIVNEEQGSRRLFRIRLDNPHGVPEPVEGAGDDLQYPSAAASGGKVRVAFCQQRLTSNLHRFTIRRDPRGLPVGIEAERPIASSTRITVNPQVSPNGQRLTFVSDRSLFTEIWLSEADGANPHPLSLFSSAHVMPGSPRWSPDGSKIVFAAAHNNVTDLYLSAADGGAPAQLTHQTLDVIRPSFSHDGKWIYFSGRETAAAPLRLLKIPARPDATERDAVPLLGPATDVKGMEPIESPEGGTVYYVGLGTRELWAVSLAGGAPRRIIASGIMNGWWTPTPGGIYYVDLTKTAAPDEPSHPQVFYFDLASGKSRVIGELPTLPNIQQPGITVFGDQLWTDWPETSAMNLISGELR